VADAPVRLGTAIPAVLDSAGVYLVTGGLGALGRHVARWLVDRGARQVALLGRTANADDPSTTTWLEALADEGVSVLLLSADVADRDALQRALEDATARGPLRGVVHAAGVLYDGIAIRLELERIRAVLAPKVDGGWHLHELTLAHPLDFFVSFSSTSGLLGAPGQGSYAAANVFLDAMAHFRRSEGLPAMTVDWGPWETGMAAGADGRWSTFGLSPFSAEQATHLLDHLVDRNPVQAVAIAVDWERFVRAAGATASGLLLGQVAGPEPRPIGSSVGATLGHLPPPDRRRALHEAVKSYALRVLRLPVDHPLPPDQGLDELGLDSLMAIELRNQLQDGLGVTLPATLLYERASLASLTDYLLEVAPWSE
jgi:NAD(P)-dependent dehydrogenase (short-subunit alcohol dehydrogenase family)